MSEREQDMIRVKRILRSPTASGEDITKAMSTYFKKYSLKDVPIQKIEPVTVDVLNIFDGKLI